jgi:uncharacterized membrane protein YeaQ/YmgE (transglycosylase-associated protein family)
MNITLWVAIGLLTGLLASKLMKRPAHRVVYDLVIAVAAAVFGGWLFGTTGETASTGVSIWSLIGALISSPFALAVYRAVALQLAGESTKRPPDDRTKGWFRITR